MNKLSIIIPCYNEKDTVLELLRQTLVAPLPPQWEKEIIVVDDCSTDGTRELLQQAALPITLLLCEKNGGKGSALKLGFTAATGSYCIVQDADLEYDPKDIASLVQKLDEGATVVYGSRNLRPRERAGAWIPRAGVWFITKLINMLFHLHLTDVWVCYKLFPHADASLWQSGHFESELLFTIALARRGHRFAEVPISYHPRDAGQGKKIRYRDGIWAIYCILRAYFSGTNT